MTKKIIVGCDGMYDLHRITFRPMYRHEYVLNCFTKAHGWYDELVDMLCSVLHELTTIDVEQRRGLRPRKLSSMGFEETRHNSDTVK
jgi:hypothetical protein